MTLPERVSLPCEVHGYFDNGLTHRHSDGRLCHGGRVVEIDLRAMAFRLALLDGDVVDGPKSWDELEQQVKDWHLGNAKGLLAAALGVDK
jgi:hypothetical protein